LLKYSINLFGTLKECHNIEYTFSKVTQLWYENEKVNVIATTMMTICSSVDGGEEDMTNGKDNVVAYQMQPQKLDLLMPWHAVS